jgi:hypothetical protein
MFAKDASRQKEDLAARGTTRLAKLNLTLQDGPYGQNGEEANTQIPAQTENKGIVGTLVSIQVTVYGVMQPSLRARTARSGGEWKGW